MLYLSTDIYRLTLDSGFVATIGRVWIGKFLLTSTFTSSQAVAWMKSSEFMYRMKSSGFMYNLVFSTACCGGSKEH